MLDKRKSEILNIIRRNYRRTKFYVYDFFTKNYVFTRRRATKAK